MAKGLSFMESVAEKSKSFGRMIKANGAIDSAAKGELGVHEIWGEAVDRNRTLVQRAKTKRGILDANGFEGSNDKTNLDELFKSQYGKKNSVSDEGASEMVNKKIEAYKKMVDAKGVSQTASATAGLGVSGGAKQIKNSIKDYYTGADVAEGGPLKRTIAARAGVTAAAYAGASVGGRYLSGGDMTHNSNGEKDIAGLPW